MFSTSSTRSNLFTSSKIVEPARGFKNCLDPLIVAIAGVIFSACFLSFPLLAISAIYIYQQRKEIIYEVSLIFTRALNALYPTKYPWWNQIDHQLYLGAIPLHDLGHLETISQKKWAVLSVVEPFELEDRYLFTRAVSPSEWKAPTKQIPAVDFQAVSPHQIDAGVQFIREMILQGRTVYVHCKAGVGRSATVVACYLSQYGLNDGTWFASADAAIRHVKAKRNQVIIHQNPERQAIREYYNKTSKK